MNIIRTLLFRAIVIIALISSCVYLAYGKESPSVYIVRNVAWNDFIAQVASVTYESPQDSLGKEMLIIQKFLKSHETEVKVGIYDAEVFKAIDQVRAVSRKPTGIWKRYETSCLIRKSNQGWGGDVWNSEQPSLVANASSLLSLGRASVSYASKFPASRVTTFFIENLAAGTAGKLT